MNTGATFHVSNASCLDPERIAQVIQVTSFIYLFVASPVETNFELASWEGRKQFPFDLTPGKSPGEHVSRLQ